MKIGDEMVFLQNGGIFTSFTTSLHLLPYLSFALGFTITPFLLSVREILDNTSYLHFCVKLRSFHGTAREKEPCELLEVSRVFRRLARMLSERARTWEGKSSGQDGGSESEQSSSLIQAKKQV